MAKRKAKRKSPVPPKSKGRHKSVVIKGAKVRISKNPGVDIQLPADAGFQSVGNIIEPVRRGGG